NLYAVCDVWAEKVKKRLDVLDFVEFAEVLQIGFHWFLIVKFKNNEQLYTFDRTIGQFLTQEEGILRQQIVMMNNFVELDEIKDFVEVNRNGFYGKAIEHPLARYIFSEEYMQRGDDLSYLAPLLKRYQFYTQHNLDAVSEKEKIITAMIRILQYNNISLSKDRELSFYLSSNDMGQILILDGVKKPRQFKSDGKVYVFGKDKIPPGFGKTIKKMEESFKHISLPKQDVILSMSKDESYAFEKLTNFPEEVIDSVFSSSEQILRKISPYLKQVTAILEVYKTKKIISHYYLSGSFLRGSLEGEDIDLAIDFAYYHDPDVVRGLLERVNAISKQAGHRFHITLQAFGYEYEIRDGNIVPTGKVKAENILGRLKNPYEKSLLRLDNLKALPSPEEFFINILHMCRGFDFAQNNLELITSTAKENETKHEKIVKEISLYLKQIIEILKRYQSERIITRYYLTGSFLKGGLVKDGDIDIALLLRSYNRPDAIKRLLQEVEAIAEKSPYKIHITPQAYGYEYEFKEGKFVHTGVIRSEELLTRLPSPQRQSLLRLDNLEIPFLPDEFFLKMMRNCREFDFTQNNWKLVSDKNKSRNDHSIYKEDLESIDPAVRLKAAIVLKKQGQENSKLAKIFQDSASNKNLTLDERLKAAEFLSESEKEKFSFELGMDEQHSLRIDSGEEKDFKKLTLELATREETAKIIKGIPGIEPQLAAEFISRMQQINWHAQELEKTLQGVGYFNGEWEKELKERLEYDYDVPYEALDMLIKRDLPAEVIFSPLQYLFAALIAQEVIGKLRQNNAVILEGDREWFLLEAFKSVEEKMLTSLAEADEIKDVLGDKWKNSTATSRTIDIFEGLKSLGLYTNRYKLDVELEAVLGSAGKFIARAYDDSGQAEFAPGPCYDQRGVSIGIESNLGKKQDSIHINQGVKWASKYIWAAYLAMYTHIKNETFTPVKFDYYYRQLVKDTNKFNNMNHRISYIGVWVKDIRDLAMILEIFIPLSIALGNYMDQKDMALARIFRDFRKEIESIIRKQNDVQLDREFFEQARMVRFVELVSANNRDNDFYRDLSRLITDTLTKIETHLAMKKKEKDYPVQELSGSIDHAFEAKQLPKLLTPQYPYALIEQAI
ncbi:MAG: nucleotidyltransferase domain-containing protein, partial [Candidatus Omnitrophica bacterium]|nr:nucleotidyltransferase domain-containing protein [Candidatus Omnitrophota bacterium]